MVDRKNFAETWQQAEKKLKTDGIVYLVTGGGETWNTEVAVRLTSMIGQTVILAGEHPKQKGAFQYTINLKSNQQAKILLAKDDIR